MCGCNVRSHKEPHTNANSANTFKNAVIPQPSNDARALHKELVSKKMLHPCERFLTYLTRAGHAKITLFCTPDKHVAVVSTCHLNK